MEKIIISKKIDFFLIKFPIWVPILYFFLSKINEYMFLPTLILFLFLGELHFGSTYAFFFDKNYRNQFRNNTYIYLVMPIMIIFFCIFIGYYFSISAVLFLILLFNFFHVNRQSVGIFRLFNKIKDKTIKTIVELLIYFFSFIFCFFGLLKFTFKSEFFFTHENNIFFLSNVLIVISLITLFLLMKFKDELNSDTFFTYLTGVLIFYPIFLTDNLIEVFAMGVGMHYIQYIGITWSIFHRKSNIEVPKEKNFNNFANLKNIFILLIVYSMLMVFCSNLNINHNQENIGIYLIPVFFQLIHFYIDMFIWKFSDTHTKDNLIPFLFSKNAS
tara:strand:+ start:5357 stop:6343 length:987 start_codon:yes stop_codon:yes gene_type:complete